MLFGGGFLVVAMLVPPLPWCLVIALIVSLAAVAGARIPASSWTTPLMELIPVFGKAGIPPVLIDLALTIYRFLFVMATTLNEMRRAQSWRLGRPTYSNRLRALSMLAGGLFVRCVDRVRRLEEGMEARGYEGRLWVLSTERGMSMLTTGGILALQGSVLAAGLLVAKGVF